MKHTEKWYENRLRKFFDNCYGEYEYVAEFYPNPRYNKWDFIIRELAIRVILTCHDSGEVEEVVWNI